MMRVCSFSGPFLCALLVLCPHAAKGEEEDGHAGLGGLGVSKAPEEPSSTVEILDREEALERFSREFIWPQQTPVVGVDQHGRVMSSGHVTSFFQGRHMRPLGGREFYEVIGRDDLAGEYQRKRRNRGILIYGGIGVQVASVVVSTAGLSRAFDSDGEGFSSGMLLGGLALYPIGLVAMTVGLLMNPHPIEPYQARELVEDYNRQLIRDLGLDRDDVLEDEDIPDQDRLWVNLFSTDDGGGITVGFNFR